MEKQSGVMVIHVRLGSTVDSREARGSHNISRCTMGGDEVSGVRTIEEDSLLGMCVGRDFPNGTRSFPNGTRSFHVASVLSSPITWKWTAQAVR